MESVLRQIVTLWVNEKYYWLKLHPSGPFPHDSFPGDIPVHPEMTDRWENAPFVSLAAPHTTHTHNYPDIHIHICRHTWIHYPYIHIHKCTHYTHRDTQTHTTSVENVINSLFRWASSVPYMPRSGRVKVHPLQVHNMTVHDMPICEKPNRCSDRTLSGFSILKHKLEIQQASKPEASHLCPCSGYWIPCDLASPFSCFHKAFSVDLGEKWFFSPLK